jgi:hypothetical protein
VREPAWTARDAGCSQDRNELASLKFERHGHAAVDIASFEWPAGEGLSVLASSPAVSPSGSNGRGERATRPRRRRLQETPEHYTGPLPRATCG